MWGPLGWIITKLGPKGKRPASEWHHVGSMKKTREMIRVVTALFIAGKTYRQIAENLGIPPKRIYDLRLEHRELWDTECLAAKESLIAAVRAEAGTDAVIADPDAFLNKANLARKWSEEKGEQLFPAGEAMTLHRFYEEIYCPRFHFDASERTKEFFRTKIRQWVLLTGDPPVEKITDDTLAHFRDACLKLRGIKPHTSQSPNSVRGTLRVIQVLLDRLGPRGPRMREALRVLKEVPWCRPPKEVLKIPRIITEEQFSAMYEVAGCMEAPKNPGISKPSKWWRTLLVLAYNTGMRKSTIFSLRWSEVDFGDCHIIVPASNLKARRPQVFHLNPTIVAHLRTFKSDRELVFPWPFKSHTWFNNLFHKLQTLAGIPKGEWYGLSNVRKTTASTLAEISVTAAQCALGHAGDAVTRRHYINPSKIIRDALDAMPQPKAFAAVGD
jgi:integrase